MLFSYAQSLFDGIHETYSKILGSFASLKMGKFPQNKAGII